MCKVQILVLLLFFLTFHKISHAQHDIQYIELHNKIYSNPDGLNEQIRTYQKSAEEAGDSLKIGKAYFLVAEMYYIQAKLKNAANYYHKSLRIFKRLKNEELIASVYSGLGGLFTVIEDYNQAIFFQRKALAYYESEHDLLGQSYIYFNIGNIKSEIDEIDSAFYYYEKSIAIALELNDKSTLGRVYMCTGYLHKYEGNPELGLSHMRKSLSLAEEAQDEMGAQTALIAIASTLRELNKLDSAKLYLFQASDYTKHIQNPHIEAEIYKELASIYELEDSTVLANKYLNMYLEAIDSVLTPDEISSVQNLDYGSQPKKSNSVVQVVLIAGLAFAFLSISFFVYQAINRRASEIKQDPSVNSDLVKELNEKNKELIAKNMQLIQQNEMIERIGNEIKSLNLSANDQGKLREILSTIKTYNSTSNWEEFELCFNEIHTGFYSTLNTKYPFLTPNERRLCGLISLNLSSKEISMITGKSVRSVEVARYRMRKKMQLEKDENLVSFLFSLSHENERG